MYILFPAPDFNKMGLYSMYIMVLADARDCCFVMKCLRFLTKTEDHPTTLEKITHQSHCSVLFANPLVVFCTCFLSFNVLHQCYRICVVQNIDLFVEITNR